MENSELITKALTYIKSETGKSEMSIDDIASHSGFSTDYFNRIFAAHTGFNVMEYVRFTRLKKASMLLRMSDSNILDIALECGYDAHESFTRAFKKQYGKTPSEYRDDMKSVENFYGDYHNETVGTRIAHEFPQFKIAATDEAIDFLLENDAIRYGYQAICFRINGGAALYYGESLGDGFIWFSEWDNNFEGWIFTDNYDKITEYRKIFSDKRFNMVFYTLDEENKIRAEFTSRGIKINSISRTPNRVYRGEPFECTPPDGFSIRELFAHDNDAIEKYYLAKGYKKPRITFIQDNLNQRDLLGNSEHSVFVFGIYHNSELVGMSFGGLQRTHGFVMNNCIETDIMKEYESENVYQYAFKYVTNAAMEKGAIPFDDMQYTGAPHTCGKFDSAELGYETVTMVCVVK